MPKRATKKRAVLFAGLACAWLLLACAPVLAHANLVEASPPQGGEVSKPPERVELHFNEPVDAEFDPLKVSDAQGDRVDKDDARIDPNDARVLVEGLKYLPKGIYRVEWRVTSVDGHVVSGEYSFTVTGSRTEGSQNSGEAPAARGAEGIFGMFPRTVVYGALSVGALALVGLLVLLVTKLAGLWRKA